MFKLNELVTQELRDSYLNGPTASKQCLEALCEVASKNNSYLPRSFDISGRHINLDIIREVLLDLGINPIEIRAIFIRRGDSFHIDLA